MTLTYNHKPSYHYTDGGLERIHLLNGFTLEADPVHGENVSFTDLDGLWPAICRHLLSRPHRLRGKEYAYLRTHLFELKQWEMATRIGVNVTRLALLEENRPHCGHISQHTETGLRVSGLEMLNCPASFNEIFNMLNDLQVQAQPHDDIFFEYIEGQGWQQST